MLNWGNYLVSDKYYILLGQLQKGPFQKVPLAKISLQKWKKRNMAYVS